MSISIVQTVAKVNGDNITTFTVSINGVAAGNSIIVPLVWYRVGIDLSATVSSDIDGQFIRDVFMSQSTNLGAAIFRLCNASSGNHTITVNLKSAGSYGIACALEVTPKVVTDANTCGNASSGTTPTSNASGTTTTAETLVIALFGCTTSQATITVEVTSPTWTELMEEKNFAAHIPGEADYKIVSSTGSYTANWTIASSSASASVLVAYREESGGGGGGNPYNAAYLG